MALRKTASSAGDEENANMLSLAPVAAPPLPLPPPLSPHPAVASMRASAPAIAVAFRIRNIGSAPWGRMSVTGVGLSRRWTRGPRGPARAADQWVRVRFLVH